MLFHEIYGAYFHTVAVILTEAVNGTLSAKKLTDIVAREAFGESLLSIPAALQNGTWPLLTRIPPEQNRTRADSSRTTPEYQTPLCSAPSMPLTDLQRRWLKTLLEDPRIQLFAPPVELDGKKPLSADMDGIRTLAAGLEDVEPLYHRDALGYFDRYGDGDPYTDPAYIERFHTILTALRERRMLSVRFTGRMGTRRSWVCIPCQLEYSPKDDKFRLLAFRGRKALTINLARIRHCALSDPCPAGTIPEWKEEKKTLIMELTDRRNALERAMTHFSDLEKETVRLDAERYQITLRYRGEDETELLIRVLSFGPLLRVLSPRDFIEQIRRRLDMQARWERPLP